MEEPSKILQGFGIPQSALLSIIFGMMLLSFPIGTIVVYDTNIGDEINFEYPLQDLNLFLAGIDFQIPLEFELGDAFIILWSLYAILFGIAIVGPKTNFLKSLTQTLSFGKINVESNYMFAIIKWFSILILVSGLITIVQESFGIQTLPPKSENDLVQFYLITLAPLTEELGFRVLLIGLPLFVFYSHRTTTKSFFKSMWHPFQNLHIFDKKKAITLIIIVGVFFGAAHLISYESWSDGKFAQATASGIILGWVYFRFGLVTSILIHWATNYFVYSYANFIAQINFISLNEAFSHSLFQTMELIFVICGILSVLILFFNKKYSKKNSLPV